MIRTLPAYEDNKCERQDVLTLAQLAKQFAKANRGRAPGPDGVLDDMLACAPREAARAFHPLVCKMAMHAAEPLC